MRGSQESNPESLLLPASERILDSVEGGILRASKKNASDGQQYWLMMTRYEYEPLLRAVKPKIRVVSFKVTADTSNFVDAKNRFSTVKFDMAYQCDFNKKLFDRIAPSFDNALVENGKKRAELKTTDILVCV